MKVIYTDKSDYNRRKRTKNSNKADLKDNQNNNNIELIREEFNEYMIRKNWSNRTYKTYNELLDQFFRFLNSSLNKYNINEITSKDLSSYQSYLFYYKNKDNKKLSISTQILKLGTLKTFFKFLQFKNYLIINPANEIELPKEEYKLSRRALKEAEIEKIKKVINHKTVIGYRDLVIIELLYAAGIRASEVINIKLKDISFENNTLLIEQGKGKKDRLVPLCELMKQYLNEYIIKVRPLLIRTPTKDKSNPYLLLGYAGNRIIQGRCITKTVQKYCKKAKVKGITGAHNFRVTCATAMLINGAEERYIQELLGHRDLNSVEHYLKIEISDLKREHQRTHPCEQ